MIIVDKNFAQKLLPLREQNSSKGTFGKVFNICGSDEYVGAGLLCGLSALRVGCGYSILCSDFESIEHYKNMALELIYKSHGNFESEKVIEILENDAISAIVLGCGIGNNEKTQKFVQNVIEYLKTKNIPTVIDADGLNCIAKLGISDLNENFILTPHPKELSRLINVRVEEIQSDREKYVKVSQEKFNATIVLKGHETLIADKNSIYKNTTGNSALAKSGSGDVLAGMIGGFLAQGMNTIDAAVLATYLHGLAAEIYSNELSEYSMLASEILDYVPNAIKSLLE